MSGYENNLQRVAQRQVDLIVGAETLCRVSAAHSVSCMTIDIASVCAVSALFRNAASVEPIESNEDVLPAGTALRVRQVFM